MKLYVKLLSDTVFGRGDGVAGLVDQEIVYDEKTGLPYIHGRTLKGLLVESCADILFALEQSQSSHSKTWQDLAARVFGKAGSTIDSAGALHVGTAHLKQDLRDKLIAAVKQGLPPQQVFEALTNIRRQTSIDEDTGTAAKGSLRSSRVLIRGLVFEADLTLNLSDEELDNALALLSACASVTQRGGSHRNRGLGYLKVYLADKQEHYLNHFKKLTWEGLS
jgi:CRISPR/Cas system CMR subunit Cmr4 (Cas7 group RAMP superfamily)